jgi:hypothetical protein
LYQSPDGDLIDCVLSHQQPAFDHPKLKGHKPLVIISITTQPYKIYKSGIEIFSLFERQKVRGLRFTGSTRKAKGILQQWRKG